MDKQQGPTIYSTRNYFLYPVPIIENEKECVCIHMCVLSCFSHVQLFAMLCSIACQASPSMGFSRQEYWNGLSFPSPGCVYVFVCVYVCIN